MRIITIVKEKSLDLELIKVKGHDGIVLNEKADQLAKEGCNSGWDIKSCFNYSIKHFHFFQ